jgi:prevent-host-death family protein
VIRSSATEVARNFSEVVNRVAAGEEIEIVRNGIPVAELRPVRPPRAVSAARLRELLASAPPIDESFARDVLEARKQVGPPRGRWPS